MNHTTSNGDQTMNRPEYKDYGPHPIAFDAEFYTKMNSKFRTSLWTGDYAQLTLMSLKPGEDIGVEAHDGLDQFLFISQGNGTVYVGPSKEDLPYHTKIKEGYGIIIPSGTYHNVVNDGKESMKLYSIYSTKEHGYSTVQETKEDAEEAESMEE